MQSECIHSFSKAQTAGGRVAGPTRMTVYPREPQCPSSRHPCAFLLVALHDGLPLGRRACTLRPLLGPSIVRPCFSFIIRRQYEPLLRVDAHDRTVCRLSRTRCEETKPTPTYVAQ